MTAEKSLFTNKKIMFVFSCQLTAPTQPSQQLPPSTSAGQDEHGGIVVPPPPMFEEGKLSMKTPLIHKKCGKDGKKDKMESRV